MVSFEPYVTTDVVNVVEGKDKFDCLKQIVNRHSYPISDEEFGEMTEKEVYDHIDSQNGDGCDFITSMVIIRDENDIIYKGT